MWIDQFIINDIGTLYEQQPLLIMQDPILFTMTCKETGRLYLMYVTNDYTDTVVFCETTPEMILSVIGRIITPKEAFTSANILYQAEYNEVSASNVLRFVRPFDSDLLPMKDEYLPVRKYSKIYKKKLEKELDKKNEKIVKKKNVRKQHRLTTNSRGASSI